MKDGIQPETHMTTSRRNLLKVGLGALPVISLSGTIPAFVSQLGFDMYTKTTGILTTSVLRVAGWSMERTRRTSTS